MDRFDDFRRNGRFQAVKRTADLALRIDQENSAGIGKSEGPDGVWLVRMRQKRMLQEIKDTILASGEEKPPIRTGMILSREFRQHLRGVRAGIHRYRNQT